MQLEVGFYHKIIPERLSELYFNYEFSYVPVIEHVAANTFRVSRCRLPPACSLSLNTPSSFTPAVAIPVFVQEVATKYVTTAFFENRTAIQDEMATALQK